MNAWLTLCLCLFVSGDPQAAEPEIKVLDTPRHVQVSIPLPEALADAEEGPVDEALAEPHLSLRLIDPETNVPGPAMFGRYQRNGKRLEFTPQFSLAYGLRYQAVAGSGKEARTTEYLVPERPPTEQTKLETIYPSSDRLPSNLLKFYLHFSQPMREGRAIFDQMHIEDEQGNPVLDPWRRTELWTADARRFTLWIHPGRVKQGVNLRVELGPVLQPGHNYTLVISPEVLDAYGRPLGKEYRKNFVATAEDSDRPLPQEWKLDVPVAGSRKPVKVGFTEPLDHGLLGRTLMVQDADGQEVPGNAKIGPGERSWSFQPQRSWKSGAYRILIDDELEDLAGNTPGRVFDRDLDQPEGTPGVLELRFEVKAK